MPKPLHTMVTHQPSIASIGHSTPSSKIDCTQQHHHQPAACTNHGISHHCFHQSISHFIPKRPQLQQQQTSINSMPKPMHRGNALTRQLLPVAPVAYSILPQTTVLQQRNNNSQQRQQRAASVSNGSAQTMFPVKAFSMQKQLQHSSSNSSNQEHA